MARRATYTLFLKRGISIDSICQVATYRIIGIRLLVLDYWYHIIGIRLLVSDYWYQIIGIRLLVFYIRLLVSDHWYQIIGIRLLVALVIATYTT